MSEAVDSSKVVFQRLDQVVRYPYSRKEYLKRILWLTVQAVLVRLSPPRIRVAAVLAASLWRPPRPTARSGRTTHIFHPWLLTMGNHSHLADGVIVYSLGPVTIGDHTVISQGACLCAGTHDYTQPNLPLVRPSITIGSGVGSAHRPSSGRASAWATTASSALAPS